MSPYVPGPGDLPPQFGPYRIRKVLGGGGMGKVYLAEDTRLDRLVALKVPRLEPEFLVRFRQEAQAAARLTHPNLCPVFDVGELDGTHYLTMRYIEGASLEDQLLSYPARRREAIALVEKLARALAAAHAQGVIHRDLKPANVLLDARGEPVVVDFGLALRMTDAQDRLTQVDVVLGSWPYMAPEQHEGQPDLMGPACDIYSLGVLLYELLTGQRPFQGARLQVEVQKLREEFPALATYQPDIAPELEGLCRRALKKTPSERFASMTAFAEALAAFLNDGETPAAETAAGGSTATPAHPADPRVADEVLQLLHEWGWDEGVARLQARILRTTDARQRGVLRLLAGWIASQQGAHAAGIEQFQRAAVVPELKAWALAGRAFVEYRRGEYDAAWQLLDQADSGTANDAALQGAIDHCRGSIRYQQARDDEALEYLYEAAERFGAEHFGFGRVLDTLGMVHRTRDNFAAAYALFRKALDVKLRHDDLLGQALTYGQLGRLLLDWGELDKAEQAFRADLDICRRVNDGHGEAQMYNHLGQVWLARKQSQRALDYLTESVERCANGGWRKSEAYARKDRALALLALGEEGKAEEEARRAEALAVSAEVAFHARRVLAQVLGGKKGATPAEHAQAEQMLRQAAAFFEEKRELAEAARAYGELARLLRRRGAAASLVTEVLKAALERAERCRRDVLVSAIERELGKISPEELYRRAYRRARGSGVPEDIASLSEVKGEKATILFLDLRNFTGFSLTQDPRIVQVTLNQVFADLTAALEGQDIVINQYLGDGFMALVREKGHARRAVAGALAMLRALETFNRPRQKLLDEPPLEARIGVCTGDVVFGNIGTYRKIDFTAVGPTVNQAARLQGEALPGTVCVSPETYERVKDDFAVRDEGGRLVTLKGIGQVRVWDVVGWKDDTRSGSRGGRSV